MGGRRSTFVPWFSILSSLVNDFLCELLHEYFFRQYFLSRFIFSFVVKELFLLLSTIRSGVILEADCLKKLPSFLSFFPSLRSNRQRRKERARAERLRKREREQLQDEQYCAQKSSRSWVLCLRCSCTRCILYNIFFAYCERKDFFTQQPRLKALAQK